MALTDYDRKHLTVDQQRKVQEATDKWNAANAVGDKAGMEAAAKEAAAVRNSAGYVTDSWGRHTGLTTGFEGSSGGGGTSNKPYSQYTVSQYTAPTLGNTWDSNTDYQAIINNAVQNNDYVTAAKAEQLRNKKIIESKMSGVSTTNNYSNYLGGGYKALGTHDDADLPTEAKNSIAMWQKIYTDAMASGDTAMANAAHEAAEAIRKEYGYSGGVDGSDYIRTSNTVTPNEISAWNENYNADNARPDEPKRDPRIDRLLNEILTRDDFSYDAESDPLYQQYAEMYRREGDRAMRETMANAAASAGGMNSYAMTAANQAGQYYASQLNDKIPELYQLAYDMYLNDKESKVQDLGILQGMDESQYNRYRNTINDWYNDKSFAYGVYQDAVNQGNWKTEYDFNDLWANKNFDNENYWANKYFENENYWANKNFEASQSDKDLANSRYDKEWAKDHVWSMIELGKTPDPSIVAASGIPQADVDAAVASVIAQMNKSGGRSGGGGGGGYDGEEEEDGKPDNLTYLNAVTYSKEAGAPNEVATNIMTKDEWTRRKARYNATGTGSVAVSEYDTYDEYLDAITDYHKETYKKS